MKHSVIALILIAFDCIGCTATCASQAPVAANALSTNDTGDQGSEREQSHPKTALAVAALPLVTVTSTQTQATKIVTCSYNTDCQDNLTTRPFCAGVGSKCFNKACNYVPSTADGMSCPCYVGQVQYLNSGAEPLQVRTCVQVPGSTTSSSWTGYRTVADPPAN